MVCPSCTTRRTCLPPGSWPEPRHTWWITSFPEVPVRQWVLSLPKRLRYFLHHRVDRVNPVLRIFLAEVEAALRSCSPDAPDGARFGAVTFVHRFGSALNANLHFHCCVIDALFSEADEGVGFHLAFLTDRALAKVQQQTRRQLLAQRRRLGSVDESPTVESALRFSDAP